MEMQSFPYKSLTDTAIQTPVGVKWLICLNLMTLLVSTIVLCVQISILAKIGQ